MQQQIFIVTGAPGSGKTTALDELLHLEHNDFVATDLDWLTKAASELAGNDVVTHRPSWRPFRQVWFELLQAILKNGKKPVLFANINQRDVAELTLPENIGIRWALLDCNDRERRKRVASRRHATESGIQDNLDDAYSLRSASYDVIIDTAKINSTKVALQLRQWIEKDVV